MPGSDSMRCQVHWHHDHPDTGTAALIEQIGALSARLGLRDAESFLARAPDRETVAGELEGAALILRQWADAAR